MHHITKTQNARAPAQAGASVCLAQGCVTPTEAPAVAGAQHRKLVYPNSFAAVVATRWPR